MKSFNLFEGIVAPIDRADIDTDAIIPKQFLKSIKKTGFGENLFDEWRYLDKGDPSKKNSNRPLNNDFVLNQKRYTGASILLTRKNFGCGSSREHAPWAIEQFGFRVIIAPSYAEIFYNNCFKNGILPIILNDYEVDELFKLVNTNVGYRLKIDLEKQIVSSIISNLSFTFKIEEFRKYCLINGLDDIGLTLKYSELIKKFEKSHLQRFPWLKNSI
tara:strand:- start:239 stop:886 length:648 start_codon:yes stop_codon:yes gene_type:complete